MKLFMLVALLAFPFSLSAHELNDKEEGHHPHRFMLPPVLWEGNSKPMKDGPCANVKLESAQKSKLRDAYFKFAETEIGLKADVAKARLKKLHVMTDPKADLKAAEEASSAVVDSRSKLLSAKESFKNQINFEILKPDQRLPYRFCTMGFHRHHHGDHEGHEFHHLHGEGKHGSHEDSHEEG